MKKKLVIGLLVACLVMSLLSVTAFAADANGYADVAEGDWYYDAVLYCQEEGLMEGVGNNNFDPRGTTTRGMVVTVLWRLEGKPETEGGQFDDVDGNEYYAQPILWAAAEGIVEGYGNNKFGPKDLITREQLATILYRYSKWKGYDVSASVALDAYTDNAKVSAYAVDALRWATAEGLMKGMGNNILDPKGNANRAQVAVLLSRFAETVAKEETPVAPPSYPSYPVTPPHSCNFTYATNNDGTHEKICTCSTVTETCSYAEGSNLCQHCGYDKTAVAMIGDVYYASVSAALANAVDGDYIQLLPGDIKTIAFTKATAPNVTIGGAEGVTVGTVRLVETTNYGAPEGLTLRNIVFNGEGITSSGAGNSVKNLAVMGCEFTNGAVIHISDGTTDGLKVENCTFRKTDSAVNAPEKTAILVQNDASNVEIKDSYIADCEHNAIQFTKIVGEFTIKGNVIEGTGSRAIRLSTKAGAALTITNNAIRNANTNPAEAAENNGEIVKVSGAVTNNAPIAGFGNTIDDAPMAWEDDGADLYAYAAVAKIGDVYYASVMDALTYADDGATITLLPGTIAEEIKYAAKKSLTIEGANAANDPNGDNWDVANATVLTGGLRLGADVNKVEDYTIIVKGITFQTNGLSVVEYTDIVISNNKFENITGNAITVLDQSAKGATGKALIENNCIDGADLGMELRNPYDIDVLDNVIKNTQHNSMQLSGGIVGTANVLRNEMTDWGLAGEGRAVRAVVKDGAKLTFSDNALTIVMAPEELVKITGAGEFEDSGNKWNNDPMAFTDDGSEIIGVKAMAKIGDVYYASAQSALDYAQDGDTIELFAGNHGDLYIRITESSELVADTYYYMSNYNSNYYGQPAWQYAKRTINNLTITGEDGAVIQSLRTTADRDDSGNAKGTRNNMFEINNLTVFGLTILDGVHFNTSSYTVSISETETGVAPHVKLNGLTIDSCNNGTGGNTTQAGGRSMLGISNTGSVSNAKNIVVKNCTVYDAFQGVYLVDGENVRIENNFFAGLAHNSIHINKFCSGTIDIIGNQMDNVADRPIRMSGVKSGTVTVSDTTIVNSAGDNGEYFKASSMDASVTLNWTNNTINGAAITLTNSGADYIGKAN